MISIETILQVALISIVLILVVTVSVGKLTEIITRTKLKTMKKFMEEEDGKKKGR